MGAYSQGVWGASSATDYRVEVQSEAGLVVRRVGTRDKKVKGALRRPLRALLARVAMVVMLVMLVAGPAFAAPAFIRAFPSLRGRLHRTKIGLYSKD